MARSIRGSQATRSARRGERGEGRVEASKLRGAQSTRSLPIHSLSITLTQHSIRMDSMHLDDETQLPPARARSTSPLAFPSSSAAGPSSDHDFPPSRQLAQVRLDDAAGEDGSIHLALGFLLADLSPRRPASSSPLGFPPSSASIGGSQQRRGTGHSLFGAHPSSGLSGRGLRDDSPLFFPP